MRITLHPRKTTRVPFLKSTSKVRLEHRLQLEYLPGAVKENYQPTPDMRYLLSGLPPNEAVPPSELIVFQKGIPVTTTTTKGTPGTGKLESAWMTDPLVEISDKVAGVTKVRQDEKRLSARVIERYTEETVVRMLKVENRTGKRVSLRLLLLERPSDGIMFTSAEPKPNRSSPPEHEWDLDVPVEGAATVTITLATKLLEKIELPPDRPGSGGRTGMALYDEAPAAAAPPDEDLFPTEQQAQG